MIRSQLRLSDRLKRGDGYNFPYWFKSLAALG